MKYYLEKCPCGSGEGADAVFDCMGIFVDYMCSRCREKKMSKYDPIIFEDPDAYRQKVAECGERFDEEY